MTEKIGIDEDIVRRHESGVVSEEHVAGHLGRFADDVAIDSLLFLFFGFFLGEFLLVCLETGVALADYSLDLAMIVSNFFVWWRLSIRTDLSEFSGFLCDTHGGGWWCAMVCLVK